MVELFARSGDQDQTPRSVASDLGLHCLLITPVVVSRLQWFKEIERSRCFYILTEEAGHLL